MQRSCRLSLNFPLTLCGCVVSWVHRKEIGMKQHKAITRVFAEDTMIDRFEIPYNPRTNFNSILDLSEDLANMVVAKHKQSKDKVNVYHWNIQWGFNIN